ncbi:uncharacterized protein LOC129101592 isoform X2 [Anoplopoma fimbria]|uniref:uncharacterized protein LOC129101592 isoform X2 n=1 Tax=Anoplopoma fimbria TaxID=229290 RepID=UPI0023EB4DB4|nr:uncharacterized protein LOC129101592 isoform X2 [Anoplopoma fimbria]
MDNLTSNKSHMPCQSWAGQNGWSSASTQGSLLNPLPSSQHLSLGSSSDHRPSYDLLQEANQSCMSDLSTLASRNHTHHSALYKASLISSNPPSNALFANASVPSTSHMISFAQQTSHASSMLLTAHQGNKNIPPHSLPQTNQAPQLLPLLSPHDPYKAPFQPPLSNQGLANGLLPVSLPSCGQHEQSQWIPSSHCRGAVNESIPDAAAHPKNTPSQEGNISPPDNNERQRSVLLHQRAQLLQQVAELDKLLESIPTEESRDGKSTHSASQSPPSTDDSSQCEQSKSSDAQQVQLSAQKSKPQSHLSSDCSSPASDDEQSEACDTPDDPMSAAESEKEDNDSAESADDSDPDFLPKSDGDFSDLLSDPDWGSSDESSHSSPSTPAVEKTPPPDDKEAKSGSSSPLEKSVSPPKKIRPTNPKNSFETVVLPSSNSETGRVVNRRNYCLFCSKPVTKMSRHLERIHSHKPEVAAVFQYPKHSRERQKIWNRLINQGNFFHNKEVLKTGKGQLVSRKRPNITQKAQDFLHCLYCRGLFVKKALNRHMKLCPEKEKNENESEVGRKRVALLCVLETLEDLGISDGFKNILTPMTFDDVTQAIMADEILLQYGEQLFDQYGSNPKKHDYIRQNLRQIARLVLEAQKTTPLKKLEDFFLPSSFPHVVSAVNVLAGYDPENKSYSLPSLAVKLGYNLQKTCSIVEGNAVKRGDVSLAESARNFLAVYQEKWNTLVSADALTTIRETKLIRQKKVPFAQDVKRLNSHMENVHLLAEKKLREETSAENYTALAKVILVRTILFNRRSVTEISLLQLTAFMSRKQSNLHDGMDVSVSDLERNMCELFTRVDIRGKCGRMVPVLLKPSFVSAMELLINVRKTCGVPSRNPYVFGRPHTLSAYRGSECIQKYVKASGAKDPEVLTFTKIQRHYGTMLQLINLDEKEAAQILGPNNQVQSLRQDSGMRIDDVEMVSDDLYHGHARGAKTGANRTLPPKSRKEGSKFKGKHKWEEAEVLAVERHMMHLIKRQKVPQKDDCIQCLESEPKALRSRSWKGVKDYVRNRITALKRQSRNPKASS